MITFKMRLQNETSAPEISGSMDIEEVLNGVISYTWQTGDTDIVGDYYTEVEVTWSDGGVETFPNSGYGSVTITDDLDA